jgi:hypothetical protein
MEFPPLRDDGFSSRLTQTSLSCNCLSCRDNLAYIWLKGGERQDPFGQFFCEGDVNVGMSSVVAGANCKISIERGRSGGCWRVGMSRVRYLVISIRSSTRQGRRGHADSGSNYLMPTIQFMGS